MDGNPIRRERGGHASLLPMLLQRRDLDPVHAIVFQREGRELAERGILVSEQATPTLLNNILSNVQIGIEQARFIGLHPDDD